MNWRSGFAVALMIAAHGASAATPTAQDPLAEAQREYTAGHYNRAVDVLTVAAAKSPDDATLHFLLGQSYYQLGEFNRAAANFERSIQLVPKEARYHDWLGKAYGRKAEGAIFFSALGLARKTHKEFETAVQLDPSNFEAERDLIRFEIYAPGIASGGDDRALKHIEALEKIDPLQGQLARGEFLNAKKRVAEADGVFGKVLESQTDRIGVYFEVAEYYRDRVMAAKMEEAVEAAERVDAEDPRLKFYRGILLVLKGKSPAEAESMLRSYLAKVPDNSEFPAHATAHEWLGKLYESQGKFSEAAEEYRASLASDPHDHAVQDALKRVEKK
jgi:tetratricopeptide (TPR) repeat protein